MEATEVACVALFVTKSLMSKRGNCAESVKGRYPSLGLKGYPTNSNENGSPIPATVHLDKYGFRAWYSIGGVSITVEWRLDSLSPIRQLALNHRFEHY